jgi:hypothetical protein
MRDRLRLGLQVNAVDEETLAPRLFGAWSGDWDALPMALPISAVPAARALLASTCPCGRCGGALTRSRTRLHERVLRLFSRRRPYRCGQCGARSWQ